MPNITTNNAITYTNKYMEKDNDYQEPTFFQKFCDCIILIYFTDFMNSNHPSYIPLVPPVPPPPPPPPFSPPPPPSNTIKKHKWHKIDCRKLSWETLSPDLLNQDTIWKKVG